MLDLCNLRDVVYMVIMVSLVILVTLVEHYLRSPCNAILGKPLGTISAVQMDFVQIAFQPPPPSSNRTLWGYFFRRKLVNFLKQRF